MLKIFYYMYMSLRLGHRINLLEAEQNNLTWLKNFKYSSRLENCLCSYRKLCFINIILGRSSFIFRGCTDVICCLLFVICVAAMIGVAILGKLSTLCLSGLHCPVICTATLAFVHFQRSSQVMARKHTEFYARYWAHVKCNLETAATSSNEDTFWKCSDNLPFTKNILSQCTIYA